MVSNRKRRHFVKEFASDRHHMLNSDGLSYQMPPPEYHAFLQPIVHTNLDKFGSATRAILLLATPSMAFTPSVWEKYSVGAKFGTDRCES